MQDAETVLNVIRERGERGLPLENIYRLLYNRNLYLRAYGHIYSNQGAMTKGITAETVDGMSLAKIDRIIDALRYERFRWTPVRRVNIPKPDGKTRALGIPTGPDKLLQEVIRMILEAYYEPQFSDHSHGFRPHRGCHTALSEVTRTWTGTRWFVEGDIKGCFDNIFVDQTCHLLPAPTVQRPDLLTAVSTTPPDVDCAAALDLTDQDPTINQMMASLVLQVVRRMAAGTCPFMGLYLDMEQGTVTPTYATPETVARVARSDSEPGMAS